MKVLMLALKLELLSLQVKTGSSSLRLAMWKTAKKNVPERFAQA